MEPSAPPAGQTTADPDPRDQDPRDQRLGHKPARDRSSGGPEGEALPVWELTSLLDESIATFEDDAGAYNQKDAEGFIKLNALRLRVGARRRS